MRQIFVICCMVIIFVAGCAKKTESIEMPNVQGEVIIEEVAQTQMNITDEAVPLEDTPDIQNTSAQEDETEEEIVVDYDLTKMVQNVAYATVYQMLINPTAFEGKTIRIEGNYYGALYEPTSKYYYYVMVADGTGCCSQGLEFIWDDGSHVYPDEYPIDGSEVEVIGTFETYHEEEDETLYCRLRDASITVLK